MTVSTLPAPPDQVDRRPSSEEEVRAEYEDSAAAFHRELTTESRARLDAACNRLLRLT